MKKYQRLADAFTPMAKGMGSEFCNQNAYDAVQVHGGSGFMKDYACERIYRDARITSIYEGTTQLQVVAAIRHVTTGTYFNQINAYAAEEYAPETSELKECLVKMTALYEEALKTVVDNKNTEIKVNEFCIKLTKIAKNSQKEVEVVRSKAKFIKK